MAYDRIDQARRCPSVPGYDVKLSQKHDYQQVRALDWLRHSTKEAFDKAHTDLLARFGGVKISHEGSCVLCPGDWACLKPEDLQHIESASMLPSRDSDRLMFQRGDHTTTFMRALAWFEHKSWPRNGIALDNFLSCGPFKPMDASHLCHQDHCVVSDHVVYESTETNQDRKLCRQYAMHLRGKSMDIPSHCTMHSPPCKMQVWALSYGLKLVLINQHAAFTTVEVYHVQFFILALATGLHWNFSKSMPDSHPYSTFETSLPLSWNVSHSAININTEDLTQASTAASLSITPQKPVLVCKFCPRIKAFATLMGLWGHLYHKHGNTEEEERLSEIKRTAETWTTYWAMMEGGRNGPTLEKLAQTKSESFCWADVVEWNLR